MPSNEFQLHDAAKRYQYLFETLRDGILLVDDTGRYVDVNPAMCRILKATREQLIGEHFSRFIPPELLEQASTSFEALKAGNPTPVDFPLIALDGTRVELEWTSGGHFLPFLSFCMCRDISERKLAQRALEQSEERQRRAAEAGNIGLWEWDIVNNKVSCSDRVLKLHSITGTVDDAIEDGYFIVDPRDRDLVRKKLNQAILGSGEFEVEYRSVAESRWLKASGKVRFDKQGRPVLLHGTVIDISSQKQAQEAQKSVEKQLMLLVEASSTLLASPNSREVLSSIVRLAHNVVDADGISVWRRGEDDTWMLATSVGMSEQFNQESVVSAAGTNVPAEPLVYEDISNSAIPASRTASLIREGVRSILVIPLMIQGTPSSTIVFYWRSLHKIASSEINIASALGNLAAAALGTADLYERQSELRREAEASQRRAAFLAESGALLASSLDYEATLKSVVNLAIPVFADWASVDLIDLDHQLKRVAIAHSDPAKVSLAEEFARRYPPRPDDLSMIALRTGKSLLLETIPEQLLIEQARDEEHLQMILQLGLKSVIVAPMVIGERSVGILSFVTAESGLQYSKSDLQTAEELARRAAMALENARLFEQSKRTEEELRLANEDLNHFAYSASHDLQEPLRMISIYSELLKDEYRNKLDTVAAGYIDQTLDGSRRMKILLRDILAYTQVANPTEQDVEPVDSTSLLYLAMSNLQNSISEAGAEIHFNTLPKVCVLDVHLIQLFQNLLGNAIKYRSSKTPQIYIEAEPQSGGVLFSVRDNGIGIDPLYKEKIFKLFQRLHGADVYAGTGVGLAICQKIVTKYGGRIWVESLPGTGSTFYFTLPAA